MCRQQRWPAAVRRWPSPGAKGLGRSADSCRRGPTFRLAIPINNENSLSVHSHRRRGRSTVSVHTEKNCIECEELNLHEIRKNSKVKLNDSVDSHKMYYGSSSDLYTILLLIYFICIQFFTRISKNDTKLNVYGHFNEIKNCVGTQKQLIECKMFLKIHNFVSCIFATYNFTNLQLSNYTTLRH